MCQVRQYVEGVMSLIIIGTVMNKKKKMILQFLPTL